MQLGKRVEKLERALGFVGTCAVCGGASVGRVALSVNGADLAPIDPPGCPVWGKGRVWKRMVINGLDAKQTRVLCFLERCAVSAARDSSAPFPREQHNGVRSQ